MKLQKIKAYNTETRIIGWMICAVGALFYSYEYLLRIVPSIIHLDLMSHYNIHAGKFGTLSAFYYYAYVPLQVPVGVLMDRYGPRRLLTVACGLCVLGTYLFAATEYYWVGALGRFLVGFGSAFAFVGVLKLATIWLPANRFAMFSGLASALGTLGAIFGELVMTTMVDALGWYQTIMWSAIAGVFIMILIWAVVRDDVTTTEVETVIDVDMGQVLRDTWVILKNPAIWENGLIGCLIYLPTTTFAELWGIPYLRSAHGLSPILAAESISLIFLAFTIGAPFAGFVSDWIGQRRLPLVVGSIGAALSMSILIYMPGLGKNTVYILLFLTGLFYSVQPIVFAVAREISPEDVSGTAVAVTNMIVMLGGVLLQPVIGILLDLRFGGDIADAMSHIYSVTDYQFALSVIPLGIFVAAIMSYFLEKK